MVDLGYEEPWFRRCAPICVFQNEDNLHGEEGCGDHPHLFRSAMYVLYVLCVHCS